MISQFLPFRKQILCTTANYKFFFKSLYKIPQMHLFMEGDFSPKHGLATCIMPDHLNF